MEKPSECTTDYWIWAENLSDQNFTPPNKNCGKWMIFKSYDTIDGVWETIKKATEEGLLGFRSKVATIKDKQDAISSKSKGVICIYTYDWTDEEDVMRVRKALRELGFEQKLPYKSDQDTNAGIYRSTGYKRISKYFC